MKKRFLSLLIAAAMALTMAASPVFAADDAQDSISIGSSGLCEHHPRHTPECGYTEGTTGAPCTHTHRGLLYPANRVCP